MTTKEEKELTDEIGNKLNEITREMENAELEMKGDLQNLQDAYSILCGMTAWSDADDYSSDSEWDESKMSQAIQLLGYLENPPSEIRHLSEEIDEMWVLVQELIQLHVVHLRSPAKSNTAFCGIYLDYSTKSQPNIDDVITCTGCREAWKKIKVMMEQ